MQNTLLIQKCKIENTFLGGKRKTENMIYRKNVKWLEHF